MLTDPDKIYPGQVLRIPNLEDDKIAQPTGHVVESDPD